MKHTSIRASLIVYYPRRAGSVRSGWDVMAAVRSGLRGYIQGLTALDADIKRFFVFSLFSNIGIGAFTLLYNLYLVQLGYKEDFIGLFNSASTIALALGALLIGRLLNARGSWWTTTYGTAAFVVCSIALALSTHPITIMIFGALYGIGSGFVLVTLMPFIVEHVPSRERSTVAAVALSLTSVSATLGSLLGGWTPRLVNVLLGRHGPSALGYATALVFSMILTAVGLVPLFQMRQARWHRLEQTTSLHIRLDENQHQRQGHFYLIAFVLAGGLLSLGSGAAVPFYNVFLSDIGMRTSQIGFVYALGNLLGAFFGLFSPPLARRFGPLGAVSVIRFAPVPLFALLALLPNPGLAILAHLVRMVSISMAWPIDSTLVADVLPGRLRATAYSWRSAAWNLGWAGASLVAGRVIVSTGYGPVFLAFCLFTILSIGVMVGVFRTHPAAQRAVSQSVTPSP